MTDQTPQEKEIESLRAHNAELLSELKAAKASARTLTEQVEAITVERDAAAAQVRTLTVEQPVNAMLDRISVAPDIMRLALTKHGLRFEVVDGDITLLDAEGNRPTIPDDKGVARPVAFAAEDLSNYLVPKTAGEWDARQREFACLLKGSGASGSGAPASQPQRHAGDNDAGKRDTSKPPVGYGIR